MNVFLIEGAKFVMLIGAFFAAILTAVGMGA